MSGGVTTSAARTTGRWVSPDGDYELNGRSEAGGGGPSVPRQPQHSTGRSMIPFPAFVCHCRSPPTIKVGAARPIMIRGREVLELLRAGGAFASERPYVVSYAARRATRSATRPRRR